jgi:hypothetical protein
MTDQPSDHEIVHLARQAGLVLPAAYLPELIEAYGHVRRMIGRIPTSRPHGDEPAHVFVPSVFLPEHWDLNSNLCPVEPLPMRKIPLSSARNQITYLKLGHRSVDTPGQSPHRVDATLIAKVHAAGGEDRNKQTAQDGEPIVPFSVRQ